MLLHFAYWSLNWCSIKKTNTRAKQDALSAVSLAGDFNCRSVPLYHCLINIQTHVAKNTMNWITSIRYYIAKLGEKECSTIHSQSTLFPPRPELYTSIQSSQVSSFHEKRSGLSSSAPHLTLCTACILIEGSWRHHCYICKERERDLNGEITVGNVSPCTGPIMTHNNKCIEPSHRV